MHNKGVLIQFNVIIGQCLTALNVAPAGPTEIAPGSLALVALSNGVYENGHHGRRCLFFCSTLRSYIIAPENERRPNTERNERSYSTSLISSGLTPETKMSSLMNCIRGPEGELGLISTVGSRFIG